MKASSLNSNDVFIIVTPNGVHMWCGKGSTGDEREIARAIASEESKCDFYIVSEGFCNQLVRLLLLLICWQLIRRETLLYR